jgi:hypothetical protein
MRCENRVRFDRVSAIWVVQSIHEPDGPTNVEPHHPHEVPGSGGCD